MLADVSDLDAGARRSSHRAVERFGQLDVLISNAGVLAPNGRIHNLTTEDWERSFRVNVLGAVNGITAAVGADAAAAVRGRSCSPRRWPGMTAWSHAAPYCATKAAVIQLAKVAAVEYARDGIRVNCVCPGTFRSAIHDDLPEEALDADRAPSTRSGSARPTTSSAPTRTWPATARRWTTGSAHGRRRRLLGAVTESGRRCTPQEDVGERLRPRRGPTAAPSALNHR